MAETVFSSAADGRHNSGQQSSWAKARGTVSSTSSTFSTTVSNYQFAVYNVKGGSRGSVNYSCVRSYFEFDLSSLSGTATSVDFKVYSDNLGATSTNGSTAYLVEATALAGDANDFGNVFTSGTTLGASFGSFTISTTLGYHSLTLNSDGLTAVNNAIGSGTVTVGLVGYYDYNNSTPNTTSTTVYNKFHVYYSEYTGDSRTPKLEITYASGYGNDIAGIDSGDILTVNGIRTINISKVIPYHFIFFKVVSYVFQMVYGLSTFF